jgi:hypothetical protein
VLPTGLPERITIDVHRNDATDMIKRHPLVIFILLTFGLTWIVPPCSRSPLTRRSHRDDAPVSPLLKS